MSRNKNHKAALDGPPGERSPGEECYWARFDYLKLRETLEAIVAAIETTAKEDLPSEAAADTKLRLVVSNDRPDDEREPPAEGPEPIPA